MFFTGPANSSATTVWKLFQEFREFSLGWAHDDAYNKHMCKLVLHFDTDKVKTLSLPRLCGSSEACWNSDVEHKARAAKVSQVTDGGIFRVGCVPRVFGKAGMEGARGLQFVKWLLAIVRIAKKIIPPGYNVDELYDLVILVATATTPFHVLSSTGTTPRCSS